MRVAQRHRDGVRFEFRLELGGVRVRGYRGSKKVLDVLRDVSLETGNSVESQATVLLDKVAEDVAAKEKR